MLCLCYARHEQDEYVYTEEEKGDGMKKGKRKTTEPMRKKKERQTLESAPQAPKFKRSIREFLISKKEKKNKHTKCRWRGMVGAGYHPR